MTDVWLYLDKSVEQNAEIYYEKAKKLKKKLAGAKKAVENTENFLKKQEKELHKEEIVVKTKKEKTKEEWYEKFRWFFTSDNLLCIGGRDATTNEIIIKKHADKNDVVLHTDMAGSPFFVIKAEGKTISETAIGEAADSVCSYSKAWKIGLTTTPVFYVKPEQVTKTANTGEYLGKGSFMIIGKTSYVDNKINLAIGEKDGKVMAGPLEAVKKHCKSYVQIEPGREKTSAVAKLIQKKINCDLDEIVRAIPAGGVKVKK